jgi:uncharacterized protein YbbC (DUF1343 family)
MKILYYFILTFCFLFSPVFCADVKTGIDLFFTADNIKLLHGKRVGLITNHTGINSNLISTIDLFKENGIEYKLTAIFSPEHGINGASYAADKINNTTVTNIPVFSLHGITKRPTDEMLKGIDVIVYDIQAIGSRSYTYEATLFYVMEEAAKRHIEVIVLDRPNPINGLMIDGPMMEDKWRSFLGYINIPYCHGMTPGELATYFNEEYHVGCKLTVISMKGWQRWMSFKDTSLPWVPTSPNIPEPDTPFYYPTTGILGEFNLVSIGIGYTLPFKVVGAPWIDGTKLAKALNNLKLPYVRFLPFHFKPFLGPYKNEDCEGIKIVITDPINYRPVTTQYCIIGILKTLYPEQVKEKFLSMTPAQHDLFCQLNGGDELLKIFQTEKYITWKWAQFQEKERKEFSEKRKKYLLY